MGKQTMTTGLYKGVMIFKPRSWGQDGIRRLTSCLLCLIVVSCSTKFPSVNAWMTAKRPTRTTTTTSQCHQRTSTSLKAEATPHGNRIPLTNDEIARYSRHLVLQDVGVVGQERLKASRVLVVGAGGLGSPCLMYLAAAGVGTIGIVDGDTVDSSNLQRQVIHSTNTLGLSKCISAKQTLNALNPQVNVVTYQEEFTSETAMNILQQQEDDGNTCCWDIVVDGSDNFPTKYLINDACEILGIPWVYSAIQAFEGQLSTFNVPITTTEQDDDGSSTTTTTATTSYRDLVPTPPDPGVVPSCAEGGVVGVLPGTMGCLQATEVIKYLLGRRSPKELCTGRVLVFDAMKMTFSQAQLHPSPNRKPITELIDYQGFCAGPNKKKKNTKKKKKTQSPTPLVSTTLRQEDQEQQHHPGVLTKTTTVSTTSPRPPLVNGHEKEVLQQRTMDEAEEVTLADDDDDDETSSFHSITPTNCLKKLRSGWSPYVLDVRLETEHAICSLPFTDKVIPHRQMDSAILPRTGDVLIYCKAGARGKKACASLIEYGKVSSDRLYNLQGGILQWQKDIDPSMPRY